MFCGQIAVDERLGPVHLNRSQSLYLKIMKTGLAGISIILSLGFYLMFTFLIVVNCIKFAKLVYFTFLVYIYINQTILSSVIVSKHFYPFVVIPKLFSSCLYKSSPFIAILSLLLQEQDCIHLLRFFNRQIRADIFQKNSEQNSKEINPFILIQLLFL